MLGYTPREVDDLTLWEFEACVNGYRQAHSSKEETPPAMDDDTAAELGIEGF